MHLFRWLRRGKKKSRGMCPVCGEYRFLESHDICPVCGWEEDRIQLRDPDFAGGAKELSLNEARAAWKDRKEHHEE